MQPLISALHSEGIRSDADRRTAGRRKTDDRSTSGDICFVFEKQFNPLDSIDQMVDYCIHTPSDGFRSFATVERLEALIDKNLHYHRHPGEASAAAGL